MGWKITVGEHSRLLDDLPISKIEALASRHGLSWYELVAASPARRPSAFYDLVRLIAEETGEPVPDRPETVRDMKRMLECITSVPDDLPSEWVDGNPPVGDQTTVLLSGEPESTDGLLT